MLDKEVSIRFISDEYWDDWGRRTKVFSKGYECKATLHPDGSVTAESQFHEGITDFVDLAHIEFV